MTSPSSPEPARSLGPAPSTPFGPYAPANPPLPSAPATFPSIPNFVIESRIGEGGMGTVYKATQVSLNRKVAVKTINKTLSDDPEIRERLRREALILGKIQHANVVSCFDYGECGDLIYVVMEYVEGENLGELLKRRRSLSWKEGVHILKQAVLGLDYACAVGVIHRDIKPENILLARPPAKQTVMLGVPNVVKIVDLGLAVSISVENDDRQRLTRAGTVLGSPHYMSPEQLNGEEQLDFRADIYSLGIMVYQVVTGVLPFASSNVTAVITKKLHETLADPRVHCPDLPLGLCQIIQKMTARKRDSRYASYGDLLRDIEALERGERLPTAVGTENFSVALVRSLPENNPAPERASRGMVWTLLAAGILIPGLSAGAILFLRAPQQTTPPAAVSTGESKSAPTFTGTVNLIEGKSTRGWSYKGPEVGFGYQDEELFLQSLTNDGTWIYAERQLPATEYKLSAVMSVPANAEHFEMQSCFGSSSYLALGMRMPSEVKSPSVYFELRATGTNTVLKVLAEKKGLSIDAPQRLSLQVWDGQATALLDNTLLFCADLPDGAAASQKLRIAVQKGVGQFQDLVAQPRPVVKKE